jgi:hypothetical protein
MPIKQGNQLLISFSYIPSKRNIDFVGIIVKPAQKIYNFEIKMDLLAEFYNLENKKPIIVQNIIPEKHYFFLLMSKCILKQNLLSKWIKQMVIHLIIQEY